MIWIGVDTGKHTGLAVWDSVERRLLQVETLPIHRALKAVEGYASQLGREDLIVVFEDARQRKWYGSGDTACKAQGAGSVKRDATIWEDFLKDEGIRYWAVAPVKGATKWTSDRFKQATGWTGRTTEHSRDAGLLVYNR